MLHLWRSAKMDSNICFDFEQISFTVDIRYLNCLTTGTLLPLTNLVSLPDTELSSARSDLWRALGYPSGLSLVCKSTFHSVKQFVAIFKSKQN